MEDILQCDNKLKQSRQLYGCAECFIVFILSVPERSFKPSSRALSQGIYYFNKTQEVTPLF